MAKRQIANLSIQLSASSATLRRDFEQAGGHARRYGREVQGAGRMAVASLAKVTAAVGGVAAAMSGVKWGLRLAAEAEQAEVAFTTLLRSADDAKTVLSDLRDFAASTPFQLSGLRDAARSLAAFGISTEEILPSLRRIGDVSSGINAPIGEIAELYGKARVQGRLFQEDINQLTGRGIPIIQQLAAQFGVAESEVRKLTESGQVSFANLEQAFKDMTATGGQFAGMMESQSRTIAGRWSTLKDKVEALALTLGNKLAPAASKIVDALSNLVEWSSKFNGATIANTLRVTAFVAAFAGALKIIPMVITAIKGIITAIRTLTSAQAIQQAFAGPAGWATLAASVAIAGGAVIGVSAAFDALTESETKATAAATQATDAVAEQVASVADATDEIAENVKTAEEHLKGLTTKAESLTESLRTPMEKFKDDMAELQEIAQFSLITPETASRAGERYREELEQALGVQEKISQLQGTTSGVGAVQRGTAAGFAAVQAAIRAERDRRKATQIAQQQLAKQEAMRSELDKIEMNTREQLRVQTVRI